MDGIKKGRAGKGREGQGTAGQGRVQQGRGGAGQGGAEQVKSMLMRHKSREDKMDAGQG